MSRAKTSRKSSRGSPSSGLWGYLLLRVVQLPLLARRCGCAIKKKVAKPHQRRRRGGGSSSMDKFKQELCPIAIPAEMFLAMPGIKCRRCSCELIWCD